MPTTRSKRDEDTKEANRVLLSARFTIQQEEIKIMRHDWKPIQEKKTNKEA